MSREKKFTKGPWFADGTRGENYPCISDDSGNGNLVAQTFCCTDREDLTASEAEANANLIAAAPDLLEALEAVVEQYEKVRAAEGYPSSESITTTGAKLIIAKAYGETP